MNNVIDLFTGKPIEIAMPQHSDRFKEIDSKEEWSYVDIKSRIEARFGDELPTHFSKAMSKPQKQPYMHGDVHNVSYKRKTRYFNKPYPVPCEVTIKSCKRVDGIITLGSKCDIGLDEPLPWMDMKYGVTLNFLKSLPDNTEIIINTRSDLVAHDDYVEQLKRLKASVIIYYISTDEEINRREEPGAPSYKRRMVALKKLKKCGITANLSYIYGFRKTGDTVA